MKSKTHHRSCQTGGTIAQPPEQAARGFTLVELLAIVAILALATILLTPALAKVEPNTQTFQCLNNARQLATALAMYSADNHDFFPPNPDDGGTTPGYNWVCDNVSGGMPPGTTVSTDMCNPDILTNVSKCLVAPYLGGRATVFRCPADPRYGTYSGSDPTQKGRTIPAVRSISMNAGVGTIDPTFAASGGGHSGKPTIPVNGPWLDGAHGHRANMPWATFGRATDFGVVQPSQIFLVLDEDPWSINDGGLQISASVAKWVDYPAAWHDHGGTFSFGDGHVELHKWTGISLGLLALPGQMSVSATDPDWTWVVSHATVKLQ